MGTSACCGGIITGENASSVSVAEYGNGSTNTGDPQQVTNTVPTGGLGVIFIGGASGGANLGPPTTFTNATTDSVLAATVATGNTAACDGAHTTATGSVTVSAKGSAGNGWGYNGADIFFVAFAVAGASGPAPVLALPRRMFLKR